jgi:hypothetical protein
MDWARYTRLWKDFDDKIADYLWHIPNGGRRILTPKKNNKGEWVKVPLESNKFKRMGTQKGVPDLFFMVPSPSFVIGYHGLFIEIKRNEKCKQSIWQKHFEIKCKSVGYGYVIVWTLEMAVNIFNKYMGAEYKI